MKPAAPPVIASLVRWGIVLTLAAPLLGAAVVVALASRRASYALLRTWARLSRRIFGIRVRVIDHNEGRYDAPPYLFLQLNQTSLSETFITPRVLPHPARIVANIEYVALPFVGWALLAQGAVVVVRQWPAQARGAVDRAVRAMRSGDSFYMSIEGRRSPDGSLSPYKKGAAVLAIRAGARVVPLLFRGAREILPYGEWRVREGMVVVELLPAIDVSALRYEDRDALVARLRALAEEHTAADR